LTACGAAVASAVGAAIGSLAGPCRLPLTPYDVWRLINRSGGAWAPFDVLVAGPTSACFAPASSALILDTTLYPVTSEIGGRMDEQWLVIRNGKVIDIAGDRPPLQQDVVIRKARIVSVGNDAVEGLQHPPLEAMAQLDASGLTVIRA